MTDHKFFQQDQQQWYQEFVDQEVSEVCEYTYPHRDFFEFDDLPF